MDKINREIVRLSIPTVVSNITIPLLGICDTAISGHLGSEIFLSAIAVGTVMLNVVFWIFGFLRGGTTGLTANALGAGSEKEIAKVFYRALMIAFSAGSLLIIFRFPIFEGLKIVAGSGEDINSLIRSYFYTRVWGAPALLAIIVFSGWFVGMQNTFYPMVIAITTNIINIGSSYMLAFPMGYGFDGIAMGTLISNWAGLAIALVCFFIFRKGKALKCHLREIFQGEWIRYFSVNGNLFLRSLMIICVTMGVTASGARLGNLTLAVNVVVMQFFQFFSYFMDGFAYSGEAMIGLRAGQRNFIELNICVRKLLNWTFGTGLIFSIIYLIGLEPLASLLTDNADVVEGVVSLTVWVALIPVLSCWAFLYDGLYIGITDTYRMMISALIGAIIFFGTVSLNYFGEHNPLPWDGNRVIWTAFLCYLLGRGIYLMAFWKSSVERRVPCIV